MICPQGFFEYLYIIGLRKKISERGVFDFLLGVIGTWVGNYGLIEKEREKSGFNGEIERRDVCTH